MAYAIEGETVIISPDKGNTVNPLQICGSAANPAALSEEEKEKLFTGLVNRFADMMELAVPEVYYKHKRERRFNDAERGYFRERLLRCWETWGDKGFDAGHPITLHDTYIQICADPPEDDTFSQEIMGTLRACLGRESG